MDKTETKIIGVREAEYVKDFHEKFSVPVRRKPASLPADEFEFRHKFMQEELDEFERAWNDGDLTKQFDALLDLQYVVLGTALMMGLLPRTWFDGFMAVHGANMQKRRAADLGIEGRHAYDVRKPPGWVPPEARLLELLRRAGADEEGP